MLTIALCSHPIHRTEASAGRHRTLLTRAAGSQAYTPTFVPQKHEGMLANSIRFLVSACPPWVCLDEKGVADCSWHFALGP